MHCTRERAASRAGKEIRLLHGTAAEYVVVPDALLDGSLRSDIAARFPLDQIASAHELVESGARGRVVIDIGPARLAA